LWLTDTIARRFALTEILATLVTVGLVLLFNSLGGTWAEEPLVKSNLLSEVAATVRIIEAAPPATRPSLVAAANNSLDRVFWFTAESEVARFLRAQGSRDENHAQQISRTLHHETKLLHVSSSQATPAALRLSPTGTSEYILAVALQDSSWTVFATANRQWGLSTPARW
jgi:two-component system osmolarity sensor histidine kinase EnvZ